MEQPILICLACIIILVPWLIVYCVVVGKRLKQMQSDLDILADDLERTKLRLHKAITLINRLKEAKK